LYNTSVDTKLYLFNIQYKSLTTTEKIDFMINRLSIKLHDALNLIFVKAKNEKKVKFFND